LHRKNWSTRCSQPTSAKKRKSFSSATTQSKASVRDPHPGDITKYSSYFNKEDTRSVIEIQFFKDKALYRPPTKFSLSDAESIVQNRNFQALPDPSKDYVWVYYPSLKKERAAIRNRTKLKSKLSGQQNSNRSSSNSKKYSFIKEDFQGKNCSITKIHRFANRIREVLDLLLLPDNQEAYQFNWLKTGQPRSANTNCYLDYSRKLKDYRDNAELQKLVNQKLQFLVAEDCLLIVGDDNYNSFYNMVQNEVKLNGKEKMLKLLNSLLDQNIRQIKRKAPGRFSNSLPPPQASTVQQKALPAVK